MGIKNWFKGIRKEKKVIEGEAIKNKSYSSQNEFSGHETAVKEFRRAVEKLFKVNLWTKMSGVSSTFQLYSPSMDPTEKGKDQKE
ncbi:MAG: hypothetical protein WD426_07755 [Anditalea sp.]